MSSLQTSLSSEPCTFQVILEPIISTCHAHNPKSVQNWRIFLYVVWSGAMNAYGLKIWQNDTRYRCIKYHVCALLLSGVFRVFIHLFFSMLRSTGWKAMRHNIEYNRSIASRRLIYWFSVFHCSSLKHLWWRQIDSRGKNKSIWEQIVSLDWNHFITFPTLRYPEKSWAVFTNYWAIATGI